MQDLPFPPGKAPARVLLGYGGVANKAQTKDSWTLPIQIGMWTMYVVAVILVMVVVMLNR